MENATLEATTLTLDQLTSPVSNIQVLPNGMMNLDVKTLAIPQNGVNLFVLTHYQVTKF